MAQIFRSVELNEAELEIIEGWYNTAAAESASGLSMFPREEYVEKYRYLFDEHLARAKDSQSSR